VKVCRELRRMPLSRGPDEVYGRVRKVGDEVYDKVSLPSVLAGRLGPEIAPHRSELEVRLFRAKGPPS